MRTRIPHLPQLICSAAPTAELVPDRALLAEFVTAKSGIAFELLVRRHGPAVWAVCRRYLANTHDAEDAFQATFLVLAKSARRIANHTSVGSWLYGVAYRVALKARRTAARRLRIEAVVSPTDEPTTLPAPSFNDTSAVIHAELEQLPDRYRLPLLLCDLEGLSRKEASVQLGWSEGTLSGRLNRARKLLAGRLSARGIAAAVLATVGAVGVTPSQAMTAAAVGVGLSVIGTSSLAAPETVAALAHGAMRDMTRSFVLKVSAGVLAASLLLGGGLFGGQLPTTPPPPVKAAPPAPVPPDDKTAKHLAGWEAAMKKVETYYAAATMTEAEPKLKREAKFDVSIWLLTPNMARMDMTKAAAPGKEANPPDKMIISTGKTIYEYDGTRKVRTSAALGPNGASNNLLLELMTGPSAKGLAGRFTISTTKEDEDFVFLEVKPVFVVDKEEFDTLTVVLCGAKFKERVYIPRMVILKRGDYTMTWDFPDPKVNPKGITADTFAPVPVPKGWKDEPRVLPRAAVPTGGSGGGVTPTGGIKAPTPPQPPIQPPPPPANPLMWALCATGTATAGSGCPITLAPTSWRSRFQSRFPASSVDPSCLPLARRCLAANP